MVSLKGCDTDWRGPAQPSKATAPHPCQPELVCDLLDVNAIKTNIVARHYHLVCSSAGASPLAAEPRMRNEEWLDPSGESKCGSGFSEVRGSAALPKVGG